MSTLFCRPHVANPCSSTTFHRNDPIGIRDRTITDFPNCQGQTFLRDMECDARNFADFFSFQEEGGASEAVEHGNDKVLISDHINSNKIDSSSTSEMEIDEEDIDAIDAFFGGENDDINILNELPSVSTTMAGNIEFVDGHASMQQETENMQLSDQKEIFQGISEGGTLFLDQDQPLTTGQDDPTAVEITHRPLVMGSSQMILAPSYPSLEQSRNHDRLHGANRAISDLAPGQQRIEPVILPLKTSYSQCRIDPVNTAKLGSYMEPFDEACSTESGNGLKNVDATYCQEKLCPESTFHDSLQDSFNSSPHPQTLPTYANAPGSSSIVSDPVPPEMMKRLEQVMSESASSLAALQEWDKKRGLPKSHSPTMVNSSRSREQLQKGVILPKWNGAPLIEVRDEKAFPSSHQ